MHHAFVDALPEGMSAIIVTADLQGRETFESSRGRPIGLLGEVLPATRPHGTVHRFVVQEVAYDVKDASVFGYGQIAE